MKIAIFLLLVVPGLGGANWNSEVGLEVRHHWQNPLLPEQGDGGLSAHFQTEYYNQWDDGRQSFTFKPFVRIDEQDAERTHWDVREAVWIYAGDGWETRVGIDKVYWGVTEAYHLVDIINQSDILENPDGEQKLGQPLWKVSLERDWGIVDAYLMPYFRKRQFPGEAGRLRTSVPVSNDQALYDNKRKERYPSVAVRLSTYVGDWDIGLAHFHGTSRSPRFTPGLDSGGNPVLVPNYDIIDQTSIDVQGAIEAWLWKFEAAYRSGQGESFAAATGGFEYTFVGIADTDADLGLLLELMYDSRDNNATTPFNHDVFMGLRYAANDVAGTEVLGGMVEDWEGQGRFFNLEASTRLSENIRGTLQVRAWSDIDPRDVSFSTHRDDYAEARLTYYF